MPTFPTRSGFWSEALDLLSEADRLHRQFFRVGVEAASGPTWEPPVDTLETADAVTVLVALPGVAPDQVEIVHAAGSLTVRGVRPMPGGHRREAIRRLEIPYGQFERRLDLPPGRYDLAASEFVHGTLCLTLRKLG
ncbi:MAG: Hsp20/alpha crystallin family protein [Lautropia sp.]